jgi:hypothetical protein
MEGVIRVAYTIICDNDFEKVITSEELLSDDRVVKAIKSSFGGGIRNIELQCLGKEAFAIKPTKTIFEFDIPKDDFADALSLAEEDARRNRRLKKGCERIVLMDIVTL